MPSTPPTVEDRELLLKHWAARSPTIRSIASRLIDQIERLEFENESFKKSSSHPSPLDGLLVQQRDALVEALANARDSLVHAGFHKAAKEASATLEAVQEDATR